MKTIALHLMKRTLLFLGITTWAGLAKGQEIVTDFWHENGYWNTMVYTVETSDKCLITGDQLSSPPYKTTDNCMITGDNTAPNWIHGMVFYKFSADGVVRDSLFINDDGMTGSIPHLFERNPEHPDHFVYAYFVLTDDTLFFRMRAIDMYLNYISDTILPIDPSSALPQMPTGLYSCNSFVDSNGDIIASYSIKDDPNEAFMTYFLRIGFDGTLKSKTEVPQIRYFDNLHERHSGMFNESPVQYCYWGSNHDANSGDNPPIRLYVLDSLFNVVEERCFYFYQGSQWYTHNWNDQFVPIDDQYYLQVNKYRWLDPQTYYTLEWILLEKRNRQHVRQATALVGDSSYYHQPEAISTIAIDSNTIYLSYMSTVGANNHLALLRLDGDLNIQWERHFLSEDTFHYGTCMRVLDDGSVAVASFPCTNSSNSISVVVIKDNYEDLEEMGFHVRPYTYYPNPMQSELHLHYSPDVQPKQVEIYDLQGRLALSQDKSLENLNVQGLAAGQYLMKVTMEDGKVYSDKVVKE